MIEAAVHWLDRELLKASVSSRGQGKRKRTERVRERARKARVV